MRSLRATLSAGACVAGLCAATAMATPAVAAAPVTAAPAASTSAESASAGCYFIFTFNQNTYVRTRAASDATYLGLAYAGDRFDYQGRSKNGFYYGRDVRPGGKTGWVPAANVNSMRVCD